jgi:tRNA pseudouridine38-40 synthase
MKTLVLKIEYDGTNYGGWQRQKNSGSVQKEIETSLQKLTQKDLTVTGAGRTDAGVHARCQVAHSRLDFELAIPESKLVKAINFYLPIDIRIKEARLIDYKFHSTRDALSREYVYSVHNVESPILRHFSAYIKYKLNEELLFESAGIFTGIHDFTTYSKLNRETKEYICNVVVSKWKKTGDDQWLYTIRADRFVYGMVRAIVGAMLDTARGKRTVDNLRKSLDLKERKLASPLAPAKGLILNDVTYPDSINPFK